MSNKNKNITLKNLEINIPNYIHDKSPRLLELFLIIGYENIFIQEHIIKDINCVLESNNSNNNNEIKEENKEKAPEYISSLQEIEEKGYGEYKSKEYPSVISSIASDLESGTDKNDYFFSDTNFDYQFCLEECLCSSPIIYFSTDKEKIPKDKISSKDYFPYINTYKANNYCFAFIFYEEKIYGKITLFVPKIFCIESKYPYYKAFHEICKDIYEIFRSNKLQIPLEIQLYNIVNYTPPPINNKIQYYLFPYQLFNLPKLNSVNFFNKSKYLTIEQLSGYDQSQINIGLIFNYFDVEIALELYLQFCLFTQLTFFGNDNQKLFLVIHIFSTLVFPLLDEESTTITSFKTFSNKDIGKTIQDCNSVEINEEQYKSMKKEFPIFPVNPNFYVFMDDDKKEIKSTYVECEGGPKGEVRINRLYNFLHKIIYEEDTSDTKIGKIIKSVKYNLNNIYKEIKTKDLCNGFYESNNDEIEINIKIRNLFYKLNLEISNFIFIYERENNILDIGNVNLPEGLEETNNVDELFFWQIKKCHYCDILKGFCKSHEDDKDKAEKDKEFRIKNILRLPRKIFASFLSMINCNPKENREIDYFRIIDSIYYQKNSSKTLNFDYLEFYKFYYNNLDEYFSQVINKKYMTCTSEEIAKGINKHFYNYKKIELESDLIMKYLCILDDVEDIEKEKILNEKNLCLPKNTTKNLDILNAIEKYYFENNLLKYKEIIRLCLINYIIMTIPKKNLVFFNKEEESSPQNDKKTYRNFIYDLIDYIYLFKNKYIEMVFSVAFRFFNNSNETNYFYIQPFIDLYEKCVVNRKIMETEEIYILYTKLKEFSEKIKNKFESKVEESKYKNIINHDMENDLFSFDIKINEREALNKIEDPKFDEKLVSEKIAMSCIYGTQMLSSEAIYSPKKLYTMIKKVMKDFYSNLEIKNDKEEKEIAINLLFYCNLLKSDNDIPIDMTKYILINLDL